MSKKFESVSYHEVIKRAIAEDPKLAKMSKTDIYNVYNALRNAIVGELQSGKSVRLPRLATFELVARDEHVAHNPQTREEITVPARVVVKVRNKKDLSNIGDFVK